MARPPEEGRARAQTLSLRVTPTMRARIDASRGPVATSAWLRKAIQEKIERDA